MTYSTYTGFFRPVLKKEALAYDFIMLIGASVFIALAAQIAIPVPFSPVPITGQTLAVLLTGILLGSKRGAGAVLLYCAEGILGLPVFAGGSSGIYHLVGPTGGYLLAFIPAAYACGFLAERGWDRNVGRTLIMMVLGKIIIYTGGLFWLSFYVGSGQVLIMGLYPFIPGMIIKIFLAAILLPAGWKLLGRK
jgi:biotin transport system substrate-specific component